MKHPVEILTLLFVAWIIYNIARDLFSPPADGPGHRLDTITPAPVSPIRPASGTVVWGTKPGGTAIAPVATGQVATSIKITPKNGKPVAVIENGDGSEIDSIILMDGFDADVELLLDSALTYPAVGVAAAISIVLPVAFHLSGTAAHTTFPCTVINYSPAFTRKGEAMVTVTLQHRPGIDGAATT